MAVELLDTVSGIHFIGDSHVLVFGNLLFRPDWTPSTYLCRTRFLPTLMASQYSIGKEMNRVLADALVADGLLDDNYRPAFRTLNPSAAFLAGLPVMAPPMVLFAGDMDIHQLFRQIGGQYDFALPDDPGYDLDRIRKIVPYGEVRTAISGFLAPFLDAVAMLQAAGFARLMIHCLPPRTPNDAAAARWTGNIVVGAPVRAKLTLLANRLIAKFCDQAGLPFIDTWPDLTADGYLRPEFELDGVHVNRRAALVSLDRVSTLLVDRTTGICNASRYRQAFAQADRRPAEVEFPGHGEAWRQTGLAIGRLDPGFVRDAIAELSFDRQNGDQPGGHLSGSPPAGNRHARPDWSGRPRAGLAGTVLAEPSEAFLTRAAATLAGGEAQAVLHAGCDRALTVASFRPIRYLPDAAGIYALPSPPETRRALVLLSGAGRVSFRTADREAISWPDIDAGSVVVYDPQRASPVLGAGQDAVDLIELALVPRLPGQPFRVVWAGLCDWPADPYAFSASGMKAAPPFAGQIFRQRAG